MQTMTRKQAWYGECQPGMRRILLALLMLALAQVAIAAEITGRVVGIVDGDTLTVLDAARRQTRVRLAEIDAPESHQPYGSHAKQACLILPLASRSEWSCRTQIATAGR